MRQSAKLFRKTRPRSSQTSFAQRFDQLCWLPGKDSLPQTSLTSTHTHTHTYLNVMYSNSLQAYLLRKWACIFICMRVYMCVCVWFRSAFVAQRFWRFSASLADYSYLTALTLKAIREFLFASSHIFSFQIHFDIHTTEFHLDYNLFTFLQNLICCEGFLFFPVIK